MKFWMIVESSSETYLEDAWADGDHCCVIPRQNRPAKAFYDKGIAEAVLLSQQEKQPYYRYFLLEAVSESTRLGNSLVFPLDPIE